MNNQIPLISVVQSLNGVFPYTVKDANGVIRVSMTDTLISFTDASSQRLLTIDPVSAIVTFYNNDSAVFTVDMGGGTAVFQNMDVVAASFKTSTVYKDSNGVQILHNQEAAIADATNAATAITQLNLLLAAARAHGLIAT